jgi:hypothetical protein
MLITLAAVCAEMPLAGWPATAQIAAHNRNAVARPDGGLPSNLKVPLVQVAGGLLDPTGAASAFDATGRRVVLEPIGRPGHQPA